MRRKYYPLWIRLDGCNLYAIWYSGDDGDGVVVGSDGLIVSFGSLSRLRQFGLEQGITLSCEKPLLHDLNTLTSWLRHPRKDNIDCDAFLSAWNIFGDIAESVQEIFDPDNKRTQKTYQKLFWGNNLPAVTPLGKHYKPIWTKSDVGLMQHTLSQGLRLARAHLTKADNNEFAKTNSADGQENCQNELCG